MYHIVHCLNCMCIYLITELTLEADLGRSETLNRQGGKLSIVLNQKFQKVDLLLVGN